MKKRSGLWRAWLSVALIGCSSFDPDLLTPTNNGTAGTVGDGGSAGSTAGTTAGDGMPTAGMTAGTGPDIDAGVDSGGIAGGGAGTMPIDKCYPNPDTTDEVCPVICPESCNNLDDDCDLKIDESVPSSECDIPNANAVCNRGVCLITECKADFRDCDGKDDNGCEAPRDDVNNCGTCGHKCQYVNGTGACMNDTCVDVTCYEGYGDCDENPLDCEQETNTLDHCTGCGVVCENVPHATPTCETGLCAPADCETDYGDCDDKPKNGCEQLLNTKEHCGQCDNECAFSGSTADCSTGTCLAEGCGPGFGECSGDTSDGCEDLNTPERCGACDKKCNDELPNVVAASCADLTCTITECVDGYGDCDDNPQTGCETLLNTLDHCGGCNTPCTRANTAADCSTGTCQIKQPEVCNGGFDNCDNGDANGCETNLTTNDDCGGCNITCINGKTCSGGVCSSVNCAMAPHNTVDCNGTRCANCDQTNEGDCETDLDSDEDNCGACDNKCEFNMGVTPHASAPVCTPTGCSITCDFGYADCNNNYKDGCEVALNTTSNCDACGQTCAIANATSKCTTLEGGHFLCEVASCNTDYADCDNNKTSCESALNTTSNCGTCMTACNLPNAVDACTGGTGNWACSIASCDQTYLKNCNNTAGDGCEVDTRSAAAHCGACNNNCATHVNVIGGACASSMCSYTCATGYKDCGSMPGCETDVRTTANCGDCGVTCSRANATATCSTGSCQVAMCNANHGQCDGVDANGCEPLNTLANCGACNTPCTTPNGTGSCSTGTCTKTGCNAGWGDCNGGLDCERDITAPGPNETGGQGPCMPDTNCTRVVNPANSREYYFCTNGSTWAAAQAKCRSQRNGDLVRIDDDAENTWVATTMGADSWIGANDSALEGAWRWSWGTSQFWSGAAGGGVVGSLYNKWNAGEPNDVNGEDCAQLVKTGAVWNDLPCSNNTQRFVCEIQADGCPSDTSKQHPGQCGCGMADTDTDTDGFANCVDGCPSDANKQAAGQCGCGMPDVQTDADGVADCVDACPSDPNKSASAGQCGCGVADTDTDGDGTADCNDACDYDNTRSAVPCVLPYTPSNLDPTGLFTGAPSVTCSATATFDTSATAAITFCGASITPVIRTQSGGPELWVIPLTDLTVNANVTLRFIGTRPVVLAVSNLVTINGTLDVGAQLGTPGAGGNVSCAVGTGQGADSTRDGDGDDGDGGGGGGAFGSAGFAGGSGDNGSGGGAGGAVNGSATLVPLRGGCRGGATSGGGNTTGGGGGGGAIQVAAGRLVVGAAGVISAAGGGGLNGAGQEEGGGGGGSGGGVFLEASTLFFDPASWITANGGSGAGGTATNNANGNNGSNGSPNSATTVSGGTGGDGGGNNSDGGNGGRGAAGATAAAVGSNASDKSCTLLLICGADGGGGGGGGGGVGRIRVRGTVSTCGVLPAGHVSPAATCP